jgi:hypothetical protein
VFTEGVLTLNTDMDVILLGALRYFPSSVIGLRERIEGLEILDVRGHEIDWRALLVLRRVV